MKLLRPLVPIGPLLPIILAVAFAAQAQNSPPPLTAPPPPPATPPAGALAAAKVAEEGDGDSEQATKQYQDIVRRYDASRATAAEALFRLAEIARKKGSTPESHRLHSRLTSEFQGVGDFAARSEAILAESRHPGGSHISPELLQRYGLAPQSGPTPTPTPDAADGPGGTRYSMSPELMRRYGLLPANDKPAPPTPGNAGEPPAIPTDPSAAAPNSNAAFHARYGLGPAPTPTPSGRLVTDPTTGFSYDPTTHSVSIDPNTGQQTLVPLASVVDPSVQSEIAELRSEIAGVARQIRKVRREFSAAREAGPTSLSVAFVSDSQLLRFLNEYDQARIKFDGSNDAKSERQEVPGPFRVEMDRAEQRLVSYFKSPYLERLEKSLQILTKQKDELEAERAELEAKLRSSK